MKVNKTNECRLSGKFSVVNNGVQRINMLRTTSIYSKSILFFYQNFICFKPFCQSVIQYQQSSIMNNTKSKNTIVDIFHIACFYIVKKDHTCKCILLKMIGFRGLY